MFEKLKKGDQLRVVAQKPASAHISPTFTREMEKLCGQVVEVDCDYKLQGLYGFIMAEGFSWLPEWLEPLEEPDEWADDLIIGEPE